MKNIASLTFCLFIVLAGVLPGCHKCNDPTNPNCADYNPCNSVKPVQANFYMQEYCYGSQLCGPYWQNYETSISDGGWIQFTCTNDSTDSCEWHIGAGVYYGHQFQLNFNTAINGTTIPIMLIVKQQLKTICTANNNSIDTITENLKIDLITRLCFGKWQGSFNDSPSVVKIVNIQKYYDAMYQDTLYCVSGLIPNYDSVSNNIGTEAITRQEVSFQIDGNGTFNIYGNALTDSAGQNIQVNFSYLDTPGLTQLIHKIFTGKRI